MNYRKSIAVNTRFLLAHQLEGIGRFTLETLQRITQKHPEYHFHFLFDRPYDRQFIFADNITAWVVPPPARHPLLWYLWFELAVPTVLRRIKPDLFLSTDGYCSLHTHIPTLTVIHDLAFEHYPEQVPPLVRWFYRHYTPKYVQKSTRIAAVSQYTKQDILTTYPHATTADRIDIVYNGVNDLYSPLTALEQHAVKQQYTDGADFFLFVGAIHPRKNLRHTLMAFEQFRQRNPQCLIKLIIAGRKAWQVDDIFHFYNAMQYKNDVSLLGHLEQSTLRQLYGAATAFLYPSFFEGFGIPILEAMRCHTPVITANVSSMPEVADNAALLVNPNSSAEICHAMEQIAFSEELRQQLIRKGELRQQQFNWDKSAQQLSESIEKTLSPSLQYSPEKKSTIVYR